MENNNINEKQSCTVAPTPIMALATMYWNSQAFLTANRIGLFEILSSGELSAETISNKLKLQPRHTKLLLDACVSLELLEKSENNYKNNALSDTYLVPGKQAFMGNAVRYSDNLFDAWGKLEECLRSGEPTMPAENYLGKDKEKTRHFVYGMHNRALGIGTALVNMIDLSGRKQLLDVGGGPGTYSALLTLKNPELFSTVLDLPPIVELAKEIVSGLNAAERIDTLPGDYHSTKFPAGKDAVLISGVFHRELEENCRKLIRKAKQSLTSGGMLILSDVFSDSENAKNSEFAALFGLNMAISAPDGGVHSCQDVEQWMKDEGFEKTEIQFFPPPMPHSVVTGYLPE